MPAAQTNSTFQCVYCGGVFPISEKTVDHIPSKSLFPKGKSLVNPILVPCCDPCNKSFSLDEEYFRLFLVNQAMDTSFSAMQLFDTKITRSIKKRPQIGEKVFSQMELVHLYTEAGIYLGEKTKIQTAGNDWDRYKHILDKYARGIYFHHQGIRVEDKGYTIHQKLVMHPKLVNINLFGTPIINKDNQTIFSYIASFIPQTGQGMIFMTFYEKVHFLSFIASETDFSSFGSLKASQ